MAVFVTAQALAMAVLVLTHDPVLFTVAAVLRQECQLAVRVQMLAAAALIAPTRAACSPLSPGRAPWVPASDPWPSEPSSTPPGPTCSASSWRSAPSSPRCPAPDDGGGTKASPEKGLEPSSTEPG
ncbi:hypothetical protein ACFQ6S_05720 [Streptomyces sp. NPDC056479]|uniref:hypothetical protein n=1 Tax=Streptomyces sp. NPDC056479 TaxID=3345832 RepID=UPI00368B01F4